MSNVDFAMMADGGPDDLPRTLRREFEAREAAARERQPSGLSAGGMRSGSGEAAYEGGEAADGEAIRAAVTRFDVPFLSLVVFFLKAVLAAIPAIILLGVILWFGGQLLETFFPELIKMKILISFPN